MEQLSAEELLKMCSYKWAINESDRCWHFFESRVRISSEMLVDMWTYHRISPDFLLGKAEKHLKSLGPGEEIDFRLSFEHPPKPPLTTLKISVEVRPWFHGHPTLPPRVLEETLYELPFDITEFDSW